MDHALWPRPQVQMAGLIVQLSSEGNPTENSKTNSKTVRTQCLAELLLVYLHSGFYNCVIRKATKKIEFQFYIFHPENYRPKNFCWPLCLVIAGLLFATVWKELCLRSSLIGFWLIYTKTNYSMDARDGVETVVRWGTGDSFESL